VIVIDCRYEYEYLGGHIKGAMNINSEDDLERFFFSNQETIESLMQSQAIIVFHCEYSQKRGPLMYSIMRNLDR
jgi:rhodanese-related sulfurtransferase